MKGNSNRLVRSAAVTAATVLLASSVSSAQLAHRYSFSGGSLADSVGLGGALNLGNAGGVTFNNDKAVFPGTATGFLTAPAGIVPSVDVSATVESWVAVDATVGIWSRVYDFGASANDNFAFTPKSGPGDTRFILKRNNVEQNEFVGGTPLLSTGATIQHQLVTVFDTTANTLTTYIDGFVVGQSGGTAAGAVTNDLNGLPQNNDYIGKSQYAGDSAFLGNIDEFRTYNSAVGAADVLASYGAGPNGLATSTLFNFTGTNGDLTTGSNYAGSAAPGTLDRATISNGGTATVAGTATVNQIRLTNGTVNVTGTLNAPGGFDFNTGAGQTSTINVNGGTLNTVGVLSTTATGTRQINLTNATANFLIGSNGTIGGGANVTLTGANTISVANAQLVAGYSPIGTLTGNISGTGGFIKTGGGVLQLTGTNTFDGNIDITAGQILTGSATSLGSTVGNTIVRSGASIRNNGAKIIAENIQLDGGIFAIGGAAQTTLSGNITVSQDYLDTSTPVPTFVADGGSSYRITGNVSTNSGDRTIILGGSQTASTIYGQVNLGANGNVLLSGGGTWALANNTNNFGIAAIVGGNTLRIGSGLAPDGTLAGPTVAGATTGALPANAVVTVTDPTSTIEFSRADSITVGNLITGSGLVRKSNVGILTLTNANNDFGAGLIVDSGTVQLDATAGVNALGHGAQASNLINAQGAVAPAAGQTVAASGILSKFSTLSTGAVALTADSSEAIDFASTGEIGLHLGAIKGATVTYTGTVTPNSTYRFGGGGGDLTVASNLVSSASNVVEIAGQGTVRLTGTNTYTGATNVVNGGTLKLNGTEELDASSGLSVNGGTVSFVTGATGNTDLTTKTLALTNAQIDTNGLNVTFAGSATSGGYVTKVGAGTLTWNNPSTTATSLASTNLFVRRGTLTLAGNTTITTSNFSSVGQAGGDVGILNVQDNAKLTVNGDFNAGDVGGSLDPLNPFVGAIGTVNVSGNAQLTVATLYLGKNGVGTAGAIGTLNQSGGTVKNVGGGDWRIGGNGDANQAGGVGVYNLSAGTLTDDRNFQIGASGTGTLKITGGIFNQTGGFTSVGRFLGGVGTIDMSTGNGVATVSANRIIVGEAGTGTILVGGSSILNSTSIEIGRGTAGTVTQTGGTVNITATGGITGGQATPAGTSTYNLSGGLLNMGGFDVAASLQNFNFTGGELRNVNNFNRPLTQTGATSLLSATGSAATTTINGAYSITGGAANISAAHTVSVTGPFTLSGGATINGTGTLVSTGTLAAYNLNNGSISTTLGGAGAVNVVKETVATVTLNGNAAIDPVATAGAGVTDLKNGKLVFNYVGGTDPAATVVTQLKNSYAGNFTTGKIRSSTATAARGIGYVDDTTAGTFSVAATLYGDANLDLTVSFSDLLALAKAYNQNSTWSTGDFNYDGTTGFADLLLLAKNYNAAITTPPGAIESLPAEFRSDWAAAQSLVPEPTTLAGLMAGGLTLFGRRRKA